MSTVRRELERIHEDTGALVSLVESGADVSREVAEDLSRFSSEVQSALESHSRATAEYVGQLDYRLQDLRDRTVAAIEATGALLYKGQKEQADQISGSMVVSGLVGGLFSMFGSVIAGKVIGDAISDAADRRPRTPDELKEKALLLLTARIQRERSFIPVEQILERASGQNAILTSQDARRILALLTADGVLEAKSDHDGAPLRLNPKHPRAQEVLGAEVEEPDQQEPPEQLQFIDLGPAFGLSLSNLESRTVYAVEVHHYNPGYYVRIRNARTVWDSPKFKTREEADMLRLEVEGKLLNRSV